MCSGILDEKLVEKGIHTKIYFEDHRHVADRAKEFLPCGKVLLLADESCAAFLNGLRSLFTGFKVLCVLFGNTDKASGLFSLPDDVRLVVAIGRRSTAAARFFCTLRGAYCFVLPVSPSARGLFERESDEGRYPVDPPHGVLFDEKIASEGAGEALADAALAAVCADDIDIDAVFTGERKDKGDCLLRLAENKCASANGEGEIFTASAMFCLALRDFSDHPSEILRRLLANDANFSCKDTAFFVLRFFAARHKLLFERGKLRPYFVADYLSRFERAISIAGEKVEKTLRIPTAEESFLRAQIFAECKEHFAVAAGLTFAFTEKIKEKYYLSGGKGGVGLEKLEEGYSLAADLSPLYSVGAIERDFGVCFSPRGKSERDDLPPLGRESAAAIRRGTNGKKQTALLF